MYFKTYSTIYLCIFIIYYLLFIIYHINISISINMYIIFHVQKIILIYKCFIHQENKFEENMNSTIFLIKYRYVT
jgi:hypothetical protein